MIQLIEEKELWKKEDAYKIGKFLIDKLFNKIETDGTYFGHCDYYDEDTFYYRGRPTNIKDIS